MNTDQVKITRALLSVSDKTGLVELGQALAARGVVLLSTGGTAKALRDAGLAVTDVSDHTGFPEMMDGRVKTLHPTIHGGLLALRHDPGHAASMAEHGIAPIDLVVVNLYPFLATVMRGAERPEIIENIDIGGPSMVRSAAKNHGYVAIVTDPADYASIIAELDAHDGATSLATRKRLAAKAFAATATYDSMIASWFGFGDQAQMFPDTLPIIAERGPVLRYGENPHQAAAFYTDGSERPGVATAQQVQGKELSYNNINDTDAAFELVAEFDPAEGPACAIIKHANPCGVARGATLLAAYRAAYDCDRTSAFGGIVALNRPLDAATAEEICQIFTEVVIAPGADAAAKAVFATRKNLRLLTTEGLPDPKAPGLTFRQVAGGFLVQDRDSGVIAPCDLKVVTKRAPTDAEIADLLFAWKVAKHIKSNAIVYVKGGATVGVGAGQMSRIDSTRIAARKSADMAEALGLAEPTVKGSVVASDAFFPFPDGLLAAAEAGATAIIQPGGSLRDADVIAAADTAGLAMVFTGQRHFRH